VVEIGKGAFINNQLTKVKISDSVTEISESAFGSNQLTKVTISNNCEIQDNSFDPEVKIIRK
jgi:hypothetical protein